MGLTLALVVGGLAPAQAQSNGAAQVKNTELIDDLRQALDGQRTVPSRGLGRLALSLDTVLGLPPSSEAAFTPHQFVDNVVTTQFEGEARYRIYVTTVTVNASDDAWLPMWAQVRAMGVADTPTLRNQFRCHYRFRKLLVTKPSWNIEASRPDKGFDGFVDSLCN